MVAYMSRMKGDATPEERSLGRGTGQVDPQAHPRPGPRQVAVRGELRRLSWLGRSRHEVGRTAAGCSRRSGETIRSTSAQESHGHSPQRPSSRRTCRSPIRRNSRRDRAGSRTRTPSTSRTISHINHDLISPIRSTIGRRVASQRTRDTESCGRLARADSRTRCRKRRRIARW